MSFSHARRGPPADGRGLRRSASFHRGAASISGNALADFNPAHRQRFDAGAAPPLPPPLKRKRSSWDEVAVRGYRSYGAGNAPSTSSSAFAGRDQDRRTRMRWDGDGIFMSRDEIERCSPSRKDGIDPMRETHLRYSYCAFIRNLGIRLQLPQTTIATATVLCHRFFLRRSHANHDRFLIATAALFLAAKSEETPCPLNTVLRVACEIFHKQPFTFFPYLLNGDWFEQYRERVIEAETVVLTTLDFELDVQHPYVLLTSVMTKLGLSQTVLLNMAWNLVNEGLRTSLWLQFKPHHIAAGAALLAAKFLNFDLVSYQRIRQEFQTTPLVLQDVVQQLMELFNDGTQSLLSSFM